MSTRIDTGCKLAVSCLQCPYPECLDGEVKRLARTERNQRIGEQHQSGKSIQEIARTFGIHVKTVQRVLKNGH